MVGRFGGHRSRLDTTFQLKLMFILVHGASRHHPGGHELTFQISGAYFALFINVDPNVVNGSRRHDSVHPIRSINIVLHILNMNIGIVLMQCKQIINDNSVNFIGEHTNQMVDTIYEATALFTYIIPSLVLSMMLLGLAS